MPMNNRPPTDETTATTEDAASPNGSRSSWRRWLWLAGAVAVLASLVVWIRGEPLQRIDRDAIDAEMQKWAEQGPSNYQLVVQLVGRMSGEFTLTIRERTVVSGLRDGEAISENRLPRAWTVDGMFETVLADLAMTERAERGDTGARYVKMLGVVDPQYGFLQRYLRVEMMEKGANPEAGWRVISFQPMPAS